MSSMEGIPETIDDEDLEGIFGTGTTATELVSVPTDSCLTVNTPKHTGGAATETVSPPPESRLSISKKDLTIIP